MDKYTHDTAPELYTVGQICEKVSLSRAKVNQLIRTGELPSVKIHASRRIRRRDFDAWMDSLGDDRG